MLQLWLAIRCIDNIISAAHAGIAIHIPPSVPPSPLSLLHLIWISIKGVKKCDSAIRKRYPNHQHLPREFHIAVSPSSFLTPVAIFWCPIGSVSPKRVHLALAFWVSAMLRNCKCPEIASLPSRSRSGDKVATLNLKQIVRFVFVRTYFKRFCSLLSILPWPFVSVWTDVVAEEGEGRRVKMQIELNKVVRNYLTNTCELQQKRSQSWSQGCPSSNWKMHRAEFGTGW